MSTNGVPRIILGVGDTGVVGLMELTFSWQETDKNKIKTQETKTPDCRGVAPRKTKWTEEQRGRG